jgi:hypothetical protein
MYALTFLNKYYHIFGDILLDKIFYLPMFECLANYKCMGLACEKTVRGNFHWMSVDSLLFI